VWQAGPHATRISAKVAARQMTSGLGSVGRSGGGSSQTGFSGVAVSLKKRQSRSVRQLETSPVLGKAER